MTASGPVLAARLICAALFAVFGIVLLLGAGFPREAGLFPMIAGGVGLAITFLIVISDRGAVDQDPPEKGPASPARTPGRTTIALLSAPVFAALVWGAGFYVASFLALIGMPWLLGYRRPFILIAVAVGGVAVLAALFDIAMDMTLPQGLLGDWFLARFIHDS
jgi:hypothetical protein